MNERNMYVVLAEFTRFGNTGEMSFGFITERYILSLLKENGRERFFFRSPAGVWFPHKERIKFFRSMETAQRWADEHTIEMDGYKGELIAVRYSSLLRDPLEEFNAK